MTMTLDELDHAASLVYRVMAPTPQYAWPKLRSRIGCKVWVKHENHTPTGAFKVRGGLVYLDRLTKAHPRTAGIVTATRGNHGQSIPYDLSEPGSSSLVRISTKRSTRRIGLPRPRTCTSSLPSIGIWSRVWQVTRWSCFEPWRSSMPSMLVSVWALESAA